MESGLDSESSVDMRTGPSTNSGEGEQLNSENKLGLSFSPFTSELTSQNHIHLMPNATTIATSPLTNDQTYLQSNLHHTSPVMEKGDGTSINSHLEAHPANPFVEAHLSSPLANNSAPSSLSSSQQNPFLLHSDAPNTTHVGATEPEKLHDQVPFEPVLHQTSSLMQQENGGLHSSFAPSTYESSQGNPFQVPTSTTTGTQKVVEHHDQGHEWHHHYTIPVMEQGHWSMPNHEARTHNPSNTLGETHASSSSQQLDPLFTLESAQNQHQDNATYKNHEDSNIPTNSMASSNLETDTTNVVGEASYSIPGKKLGSSVSSFSTASESSTQDLVNNSINVSSNNQEDTNVPRKMGKDSNLASESSDDDIPISSMPKHGQQYSSVLVVPEKNNGSEIQNPPVQVMERSEDPSTSSTNRIPLHVFARNKSNTQWSTASNESLFSIQMGNMSFSNDMAWLNKSGELDKPSDMNVSGAFQSNHPPLPLQPQQPKGTKFNDISQSTAEQNECSKVTEEKAAETMREVIMESSITTGNKSKGDLTFANGATRSNRHSNSNDHSHHSDGSTKSFAFKVLTDGDKTPSSKRVEERRRQQQQSQQQTIKETSTPAQKPKSASNASQNKWLSCFTCCH